MPFELLPTLQGELLRLRPLREDDFGALLAAASDPLIWEQHPQSDRWREPVFRKYFESGIASGGALLATDLATGAVIGSSRYHALDEAASEVEVGYSFLARPYWGGVYNGEMKRLMLRHAFRFVKTVVLRVGPTNFRSQRAVEKIGGVRVGMGIDAAGRECVVFHVTSDQRERPTQPPAHGQPCAQIL